MRSSAFLIDFPLSFTMNIINVWMQLLPQEGYIYDYHSEEDGDMIVEVKDIVKNFRLNMTGYVA